jgi:hypothetical protein
MIEVVKRLNHWALGKVAVVRQGESYCTVLMSHSKPTLNWAEHALPVAADSTRGRRLPCGIPVFDLA